MTRYDGIPAQRIGGNIWFHFKGRTYCVEVEKKRKAAQHAKTSAEGDILAPMPGKILKVSAKPGQKVTKNDVLVVMEAMKMEYSLNAPRDGIVEKVRVRVDQQVVLGEVLVALEKSSEKAK